MNNRWPKRSSQNVNEPYYTEKKSQQNLDISSMSRD